MTPDLEQALAAEKARVVELERHRDMLRHLLDEANGRHFDATMRAEAAESSIASLTRLVGDMREAIEGVGASAQDFPKHAGAPRRARRCAC